MTTPDEFRTLIESPESTRVEFKAASGGFHSEERKRSIRPGVVSIERRTRRSCCSTSRTQPRLVQSLKNSSRSSRASAVTKYALFFANSSGIAWLRFAAPQRPPAGSRGVKNPIQGHENAIPPQSHRQVLATQGFS